MFSDAVTSRRRFLEHPYITPTESRPMASESYAARPSSRSLPRAELVLGLLALASFALIPVRITTIYSGLPAHPLFLQLWC
jgi:hypothetical protein